MRKKLILALVVAISAAVITATLVRAKAYTSKEEFDTWLHSPCNGEWIYGTMKIHRVESFFHEDNGGGFHVNVHGKVHFSGVGEDSGAKYESNEKWNESFNMKKGATRNVIAKVHIIGQGQVPDFVISGHWKFTINANGELVVEFSKWGDPECKESKAPAKSNVRVTTFGKIKSE